MKNFKEFHVDRVGTWPGHYTGSPIDLFAELADSLAAYVDEAVSEMDSPWLAPRVNADADGKEIYPFPVERAIRNKALEEAVKVADAQHDKTSIGEGAWVATAISSAIRKLIK